MPSSMVWSRNRQMGIGFAQGIDIVFGTFGHRPIHPDADRVAGIAIIILSNPSALRYAPQGQS